MVWHIYVPKLNTIRRFDDKFIELLKKLPEPQGSRDNNMESNEDGEENDNCDDEED